MKNKKTFYITTPIYYPSGNLHIGHLYSTSIAWMFRNYKKKNGYDTLFLTGIDEHGQKIQQKAFYSQIEPQLYVDQHAENIEKLWNIFGIDYDIFSRTTKEKHTKSIQEIFSRLLKEKIVYLGDYTGLYSVQDEEFFTKSQAKEVEGIYYHPQSNHKLEIVKEKTYFFKMSQFQEWIKKYLNNNNLISNPKILKELINNFLNDSLEDLSITRSTFTWGIPIKEHPQHVIYVWLDALFNYVTMLNIFEKDNFLFEKYWKNGDEIVHVVGKEITRFHCIYWPILLKSIDLKLPTKILSHGWLITPEGKMSKSKGNIIEPLKLIKEYNPEIIKYFLVSKFKLNRDASFDPKLLKRVYNSDLANNIGNLIQRTLTMKNDSFAASVKYLKTRLTEIDKNILTDIIKTFEAFKKSMDEFKQDKAFEDLFAFSSSLNNYIDLTTPWLLKDNLERLEVVLNTLLNGIYLVISCLEILMPKLMEKFKNQFDLKTLSFEEIKNFNKFDDLNPKPGEIIFKRKKK